MTQLEVYIQSYFGIEETNLEVLSSLFKVTQLKKDQFFSRDGEVCNKLSFVKSGYLRVFKHDESKDVTQWISSEGEFVTDLGSLMFDQPARFNIQALTDCEFYTINKFDYNRIADLVPEWQKLEKLFLAKCFMTLENRVYSFLSMSAEQRYNYLFETKKELFNQIPLQYLASMLGMTPETLSRIRRKSIS